MFTLLENVSDPTDLIPLDDLKDLYHIDGDHEDGTLTRNLAGVLQWWRKEGGNIPLTWRCDLPCFPCGPIELKKSVISATVSYYDVAGDDVELSPGDEETDAQYRLFSPDGLPSYVEPVTKWPATTSEKRSDVVRITFSTADLDAFDVMSVGQLLGLVMENREGFEMPTGILRLLSHARGASYA